MKDITVKSAYITLSTGEIIHGELNANEPLKTVNQTTIYNFESENQTDVFTLYETTIDDSQAIYKLKVDSQEVRKVQQIGFSLGIKNHQITHMLSAPFDNDKWAKFIDYDIEYSRRSYNFTAFSGDKEDWLFGALDLDVWKTGFEAQNDEIFCISGVSDERTRDFHVPHGSVEGSTCISSEIYISRGKEYQKLFPAYGDILSERYPAAKWNGSVPYGWNSWAGLMGSLSYDKYLTASSFLKEIQENFQMDNGKQWVNLDAMWNQFTNHLEEGVKKLEEKNQEPGFYLAPFITTPPFNHEMPGTMGEYFFEDALLRNHDGEVLRHVDGLYSLDPTHPGTIAYTNYEIKRMKSWGFKYVKIDFLGHAAREGRFYDENITTGMQAYKYATEYMKQALKVEEWENEIFVNLSIAPIFSFGFGHSRRISCDAFGSTSDSEYVNNSTTYLWWLAQRVYAYNDPDHLVLYKSYDMDSITYEEAKMRLNTGIVCGGSIIYSEDFDFNEAKSRAKKLFKNKEVLEIGYEGRTFIPIKGTYSGAGSATSFIRKDATRTLLAVFNYNVADKQMIKLSLKEIELTDKVQVRDLYTKNQWQATDEISLCLKPGESTIIEII